MVDSKSGRKKTGPQRRSQPRDLVPGFAALVKKTREERDMSQRKLAERAKVSPMCICDLEAERRSPSLRVASRVARALKLSVTLARPTGPKTKPRATPATEPVRDVDSRA